MANRLTRREAIRQAALQCGAVWALLGQTPSAGLKFFTAAQAREVEAIAAQIIPADELGPGAREAGVVRFIDLVLASFEREKQPEYRAGLKELGPFAELDPAQQVAKLRAIEKTTFFETVREHTIAGFLSHPKYGGNRDGAGFRLLGFEDRHVFQPPFGYYDGPEGSR
jgi:gluconate 2-dehydrogenase gamma chain